MTETELINLKISSHSKLNESDIIKLILEDDLNNPKRRKIFEGERYYTCEHDILNKDFRQSKLSETTINDAGQEKEDFTLFKNPNRSNHHNINPFHKILVEQKVSYIVGREPSVTSSDGNSAYNSLLSHWFDEKMNDVLQDLITDASNAGYGIIHVYYDIDGKLQYCNIPAKECILIYDSQYQKNLEQVIRHYEITEVKDGRKVLKRRVEWWTKNDVTYWIENENNTFIQQGEATPHWWNITTFNGFEKEKKGQSWGRVPFIILKNNSKCMTDLESIKGLIDAYDLISSEGTNSLIDLVDLYWVIAGYGGETTRAIAKKLQVNKAVNISDSSGSIEAKQVDIPVDGRLNWLKMLRKDIFHFGQGIDVDADKFGNAPSGVSLKFQYSLLDLKSAAIISKLKVAIKELFWFLTFDFNRINNTDFDSSKIDISINKNMIANDMEMVNIISSSKGIVSDETLLSKHPLVDDVNEELTKLEKQRNNELDQFNSYSRLESSEADEQ